MLSKKKIVKIPIRIFSIGILTSLAFFTLKVTGHIAWSWWLVFAPTWVPIILSLGLLICALLGMAFISLLAWFFSK